MSPFFAGRDSASGATVACDFRSVSSSPSIIWSVTAPLGRLTSKPSYLTELISGRTSKRAL
jgi:hypothetical protein